MPKLLLMAVLAVSLAGCSAARTTLSREFQGRWEARGESCTDPDGVAAMWVQPDQVQFYESGGEVSAIRRTNARTLDVTFRDWSDDQGEAPVAKAARMALSTDGDAMTFTVDGYATVYLRCPASDGGKRS